MANTSLIVPAEQRNPKTGDRQFDFEQLKIFLTNVVGEVDTANGSANSTNASVTAAYNQANLALATAEVGIAIGEAAYDEANVAAANAATANATAFYAIEIAETALETAVTANGAANTVAVYYDGNLITANANVNFNDTSTVNANVYISLTPGQIQANIELNANGTAIVGPTAQTANTALMVAEQANTTANLALPQAGGTITGNLTILQNAYIEGDLIITGNLVIGANLSVGGVMNVANIIGLMSINYYG